MCVWGGNREGHPARGQRGSCRSPGGDGGLRRRPSEADGSGIRRGRAGEGLRGSAPGSHSGRLRGGHGAALPRHPDQVGLRGGGGGEAVNERKLKKMGFLFFFLSSGHKLFLSYIFMTGEGFALRYYNTAILKRSSELGALRRCVGDSVVLGEVIWVDFGRSELAVSS